MRMQLKKNLNVAEKLALATATLLGATAQAETVKDEWQFVGSILTYSEPDRVSALETIFTADKAFDDTAKLSYKIVLDSLTGASANGAIAQDDVQTFTRPSGNGQYIIQPQETPLDDTFKDTRAQFSVNWSDRLTEDSQYTIGTNLSREYDYQSIGISGELARDFDRKNTTLSIGLSYANDSVSPEGGRPLGFSSMVIDNGQFDDEQDYRNAFNATRISGDGSIDTTELLLGWTQIINRRMIMQMNYGYADVKGYLTDPFKVLSVIDSSATAKFYLYENRPESKKQHSFFALTKYHLNDSIIDFSYRYIDSDWDIKSHTLDLRWRLFAGKNSYWEPHVRYYQQSAADFYYPYFVEGTILPEFGSADYRIGEMDTYTIGLKYGFLIGDNRTEVRAEYYHQTPKSSSNEQVIITEDLNLYPSVDAFTLQFTYYFD